MTYTDELIGFADGLRFEAIPPEAIAAGKRAMLDSLGCTLGGSRTTLGEGARNVVETLGGAPQASIVGTRHRSSVTQAAFVNSIQANALDYDDGFEDDGKTMGHPGASIIPAAIAMAEWRGCSGRELLTAVIAGYEVCNRVIRAIQPTPERHAQVWGVAVHQTFGAASAAGKLAGLTGTRLMDAVGLAAATSTVPAARKWNWTTRPLFWLKDVVAWPAEAGVRAALLAEQGFVGSRDILDGDRGYWRMAGSDRCDFARLTDRLGQRWTVQDLYYKPYPACRWVHAALEAVELIAAEHPIEAARIAEIEIGSFADLVESFADYRPAALPDAEFSMPYTMAVHLAGVPRGPDWYSAETLRRPDILALADKVKLVVDEESQRRHFSEERKQMAVVTIRTTDGQAWSRRVAVARGGAGRPFTQTEIEEKYRSLAEPVLGTARAQALAAQIERIETLASASTLAPMLFA